MFVDVVWFCCSSWLASWIMTDLINLMRHFLLHWVICFGGYLFGHTSFLFWKILQVLGISICSSFGRIFEEPKLRRSGSELYVRAHIIEPFCFCLRFRAIWFYIARDLYNVNEWHLAWIAHSKKNGQQNLVAGKFV